MGIDTALLTGDSSTSAKSVAHLLGVKTVYAELLPQQKLLRLREAVQNKRNVAMVGDGINDAPALAEASVGVAMGSGTDVARESADVVLIGNDLSRFVESLRIARTLSLIRIDPITLFPCAMKTSDSVCAVTMGGTTRPRALIIVALPTTTSAPSIW